MSAFLVLLFISQWGISDNSNYGKHTVENVDYDAGLVYYEEWVDSVYLGLLDVKTVEEYFAESEKKLAFEGFRTELRNKSNKREAEGVGGFIPDIKIQMGKEKTEIRISGQDRITLGGSNSVYPNKTNVDNKTTASGLGINLKQDLDVKVNGIIARKTKVEINHKSGGNELFDNNKVKLSYTGDDDEIVKKIEAGDVSLNLGSNTQQLPAHQGLFGINGQVKLGPVDIYAVASREETKSNSGEFKGSSQTISGEIYDRSYVARKYFFVFYEDLRKANQNLSPQSHATDSLLNHFVLYADNLSRRGGDGRKYWVGNAWIDPSDTTNDTEAERGKKFVELERGKDYELVPYNEKGVGWVVELSNALPNNSVLAVACTTLTDTFGWYYDSDGDSLLGVNDTLNLLLIWPQDPSPSSPFWNNMRRNHYKLSGSGEMINLRIDIIKEENGSNKNPKTNERYAYTLGLTLKNNNTYTLLEKTHEKRLKEIIFDDLNPFLAQNLDVNAADSTKLEKIYKDRYQGSSSGGVFKIRYSFETIAKNIKLGIFAVKNSEQVWVDGIKLKKSDGEYTVDYESGILTILKDLNPNSKIKVTWEEKQIFALDQKSLLGLRAESELTDGVTMGGSILYRNEAYSSDIRPVLGLEPFSRALGQMDLSVKEELNFLTKAVDKIPLVSTETKSSMNIGLNAAMSMPNPNTHRSASVWIEDFEGVKQANSVNVILPLSWYQTSTPIDSIGSDSVLYKMDTAYYSRRRPLWTTREILDVQSELHGNPTLTGKPETGTVMKIDWRPESNQYWTGIIGSNYPGLPLDISKAENLEVIMRTNGASGKIHFDFGSNMDEDQLRLNKSGEIAGLGENNDEDINGNDNFINSSGDDNEDIGLDEIPGTDADNITGDDGNDDSQTDKNKNNYNPNGTEGNGKWDGEDLDRDGFNTTKNDYSSLVFDLSDSEFIRQYVDSLGGTNGWIRLSIPLANDSLFKNFGENNMYAVDLFRIWFDNMASNMDIEIYSWSFVGNKWEERDLYTLDTLNPVDSLTEAVYIDVVGTETDENYKAPFPLNAAQNEQDNSIRLVYKNLANNHAAKVTRWDASPDDFRGYKRLKLYVHNDKNDPLFYFRMGSGASSYYEVRNNISKGRHLDNGWTEFTIELDNLVKLKNAKYDTLTKDYAYIAANDDSTLLVRGAPTFASVKYFELGVINKSGGTFREGEIWFNDIRLNEPYKNIGSQFSISSGLNFADLATVRANYSRDEGSFTNLVAKNTTPLVDYNTNFASNATFNLHKFALDKIGFSIPVIMNYSYGTSLPRYDVKQTDYVLLAKDEQMKKQSINESKGVSFSVTHSQSKNKLLKYTLDALRGSISYSWSDALQNSGLDSTSSLNRTYGLSYAATPDFSFKVGKTKISYAPKDLNLSAKYNNAINPTWSRDSLNIKFNSDSTTMRNSNAGLTLEASTSYDPVKYIPLTAKFIETRAVKSDSLKPATITDFFNDPSIKNFYYRKVSLSAGLKYFNFGSFGNPVVNLSSTFKQNQDQNISVSNHPDSIYANLNNAAIVSLKWVGFNPSGIFSKQKTALQKDLDARKEEVRAILQAEDSVSLVDSLSRIPIADTLLADSMSADTVSTDTSLLDTISVDSSLTDSLILNSQISDFDTLLISDTLQVDSFTADTSSIDTLAQQDSLLQNKDSLMIALDPQVRFYEERIKALDTWKTVTKFLLPITVGVNFSRNSSYNYYRNFDWGDNWRYIIGITDTLSSDTQFIGNTSNNITHNDKIGGDISTGLNIESIDIRTSARYSQERKLFSSNTYSNNYTPLQITVSYSKLGDALKEIATSSNLTSSFSYVIAEKGRLKLDTIQKVFIPDTTNTNISKNLRFSPLLSWSTQWKNKISTNLSVNYSLGDNYIFSSGQMPDTLITKTTEGLASISYTFNKPSGFKLGFLKHLKFKNDITLDGTLSYKKTEFHSTIEYRKDTTKYKPKITTETKFNAGLKYTFSDAFDGGATFNIGEFNDSRSEKSNRVDLGLDIFVVFKF